MTASDHMLRSEASATALENNAVILNGVSPRAKAGAKRSEESLTVTRAEAAGGTARTPHRTASAHGESAILHSGLVRKASQASVQDEGRFFSTDTPHPTSMFHALERALRGVFRGAHASRVLVAASRRDELPDSVATSGDEHPCKGDAR
jgi:hypothetical protein